MRSDLLCGKVAILTGGCGLLGKEFAKAILENQGICILADINSKKGFELLGGLSRQFGQEKVAFVKLDITSQKSITKMVSCTFKKFKRIDALINNTYPRNNNYGKKFEEVTYKDFSDNVNNHLGGYFLASQQLAKFFKKQGYGNIINIASIYGVIAPRFEIYKQSVFKGKEMTMPVEYAAIKSAIIHLTKYMVKYFKGTNIRVNCLSPGGVFNAQPPEFCKRYKAHALSKGLLEATDLTGTLVYLLSDMSRFVNGQNIIVDDGWCL